MASHHSLDQIKMVCTNQLKKDIFWCLKNSIRKKNNPFIWKNLAIDIQLSIYTKLKHDIYYIKENLTYKSDNFKNLDKIYANYFSKKFWIRRKEQHYFNLNINKNKRFKGIDFYLTKLVLLLINKLSWKFNYFLYKIYILK